MIDVYCMLILNCAWQWLVKQRSRNKLPGIYSPNMYCPVAAFMRAHNLDFFDLIIIRFVRQGIIEIIVTD